MIGSGRYLAVYTACSGLVLESPEVSIISNLISEALSFHYALYILWVRLNAFLVMILLSSWVVCPLSRCDTHRCSRGELG